MMADAPRQARIMGCVSCHGEGLKGNLMAEIPNVARIFAPNLTEIAARSTDQQLAAAIRQGIGHDGRPLLVMPSPQYSRMSDQEVAALIRWIRTLPRVGGGSEHVSVGPLGRVALAAGKIRTMPEKVEEYRTQAPISLGAAHAAGQRLAANDCSECHGPALFGQTLEGGEQAPDLTIVGAYDYDQFRTLLSTGRAPGGRDVGLMTKVAKLDLKHLREDEMKALYDYLKARADRLAR
jgi:cytochrome c553